MVSEPYDGLLKALYPDNLSGNAASYLADSDSVCEKALQGMAIATLTVGRE